MAQSDTIITKLTGATNWALWRCNETSGNLADSSGNGFTLIARQTPAYSQAAVEGNGIAFDGSADESATALIAPIGSTLPDAWTMGLNVKGSPQASKCLFSLSNGSTAGVAAFLTGTSAGVNDDKLRIQVQVSTGVNVILSVSGGTILDDTWHHVVVVGSGGNSVTAYIDGSAQTPVSGTWSTNRPSLSAAGIAAVVLNSALPQNPSSEAAITVENAFVADIALSSADVIDIYNAGAPDTTAPTLSSAVVQADGQTVVLTFEEIGSPPLLPASAITGFSITRLGVSLAIDSVARTGNTEITITMDDLIEPGSVLLSYASGNVTDSSSNALASIVDFVCTNNSVIATYAKITMLASVSSRMAPHTVWVTSCEESVPINGDWRYCSATWNFGDGSGSRCLDPIGGSLKRVSRHQTSWACASHTYQSPGTYAITLTLTGSDGITKTATTSVTVVADTRTTKYLNSAASPGGDGSQSTPWSTHAEMDAGLTSNTKVLMSGSFDLTDTTFLPAVSNVWFKPESTAVTFHWTTNPADDAWVFGIPAGAENILIDGILTDHASRGIIVTSDVGKSLTKSDNQTGLMYTLGNGVTMRNCTVVGDFASGGIPQGSAYGGNSSQITYGLTVENCTFGNCNNYNTVFTQMRYVCFYGCYIESAWIEHSQRWLNPASKYIAHQWNEIDQKLIGAGVLHTEGNAAKDCIRFQSVEYATVHDCLLQRGVLDLSYQITLTPGGYGPGYHIQYSRCIIDDCGIYCRPDMLDVAIANCYIKQTPLLTDTASPIADDKELTSLSILHNTFADMAGAFSFLDFSVLTNTSHAFTRSDVEISGNLFCTTAGQTGSFIFMDDVTLYTIFSDISRNIMTDGLSTYVRSRNATTQGTTSSINWATFVADYPNNDQDTITSAVMDALTQYRPLIGDNPNTVAGAVYRTYGVLSRDLYNAARPGSGTWYSGAVDAIAAAASGFNTSAVFGNGRVVQHTIDWVSDSFGNATVVSNVAISGSIDRVVIIPSGSAAPTTQYDVTLTDSEGIDVLGGNGADQSATLTATVYPVTTLTDGTSNGVIATIVNGLLTLNVSNAGNAKAGRVVVYVR